MLLPVLGRVKPTLLRHRYIATAAYGYQKANAIANPSNEIDAHSRRPWRRVRTTNALPWCILKIKYSNNLYDNITININAPYAATGTGAAWFSSTHAVKNGISDNQNRKFKFPHKIVLSTRSVAANK